MSITKNTRRKKKLASAKSIAGSSPEPQAQPRFPADYIEKYAGFGVVHESDIRQLISTTQLAHLRAFGGRFTVLMEALEAARQQPSVRAQRALANLIAELEQESCDRRYRQILQVIAEAAQSEEGLDRACWTAMRTVEMLFEWSAEYMFAFRLYTQGVKHERRPARMAAAAGRTMK